jgi:hypothetical protein
MIKEIDGQLMVKVGWACKLLVDVLTLQHILGFAISICN